MANDKDFIVKNAVEVGGSTKTTLGTVTNDNIDLSTGNYFAHSPSGATTYTISNAATNQSFQLEVTGGTEEVAQNFSTTLYTGTSATQTVTNGIDLATDGGLVWIKRRDTAQDHWLFDSERNNFDNKLTTNDTSAEIDTSSYPYDLDPTSSGFIVNGSASNNNLSGATYASWTFKKQSSFFDVVTYTGDGSDTREVSHNLGSKPGMIAIKSTSTSNNWVVWHRGATGSTGTVNGSLTEGAKVRNAILHLNTTGALASLDNSIKAPSSTTLYFGDRNNTTEDVNVSGRTYVAYLFAHDTASDGLIQCGSYTGNGSASGPSINLGWEPQWLLLKNATTGGNSWGIIDNQRGITGNEAYLFAQANWGEDNTVGNFIDTTYTGFDVKSSGSFLNGSGDTIIYIAIRSAADLDLTWPTSIEWAGGVTPAAPATGETDLFSISTDDGGTTYQGFKVADNLS